MCGWRCSAACQSGFSAYRSTTRFDEDESVAGFNLSDRLDRAEQGLRLVVLERLTSLTTVGLIVETREDRFERAPDRDADGYRVAGTIVLAEKALISGTAEIGYRHVKPNDDLVPAFNGLVSRIAVSNRIGGSTAISLGWDRDMPVVQRDPALLSDQRGVRTRAPARGRPVRYQRGRRQEPRDLPVPARRCRRGGTASC